MGILCLTFLNSGRASPPTKIRAAELGIEHVLEGCHYKLPALEKLLDELGLAVDDLNGALGTSNHAVAATIAQILVYSDDLSFHNAPLATDYTEKKEN